MVGFDNEDYMVGLDPCNKPFSLIKVINKPKKL